MRENPNNWVGMENNSHVGLGIHGGVMGGWIKGLVYGADFSGDLYGSYTHGKMITNDVVITLNEVGDENRVPTYAMNSTSVDVYTKGKGAIINGIVHVNFDENFKKLIGENNDVIITVSPLGECNGLFVKNVTFNGFDVKELQNGSNNVEFSWIAIGTKNGYEEVKISPEILNSSFENKMKGIMHNENNPEDSNVQMWWDGTQVRFDSKPERVIPQDILNSIQDAKRPQNSSPQPGQ